MSNRAGSATPGSLSWSIGWCDDGPGPEDDPPIRTALEPAGPDDQSPANREPSLCHMGSRPGDTYHKDALMAEELCALAAIVICVGLWWAVCWFMIIPFMEML